MRVAIPHQLGRDEARRRLKDNIGSLSDFMPGGLAQVAATWPSEDELAMTITAMGQTMEGRILVEESQAVIEVVLPPALSFVEPMIQGTIEKSGRKLLS
jgi:hypothetical protein